MEEILRPLVLINMIATESVNRDVKFSGSSAPSFPDVSLPYYLAWIPVY